MVIHPPDTLVAYLKSGIKKVHGLPQDAELESLYQSEEHNRIELVVSSSDYDVVEDDGEIPEVDDIVITNHDTA